MLTSFCELHYNFFFSKATTNSSELHSATFFSPLRPSRAYWVADANLLADRPVDCWDYTKSSILTLFGRHVVKWKEQIVVPGRDARNLLPLPPPLLPSRSLSLSPSCCLSKQISAALVTCPNNRAHRHFPLCRGSLAWTRSHSNRKVTGGTEKKARQGKTRCACWEQDYKWPPHPHTHTHTPPGVFPCGCVTFLLGGFVSSDAAHVGDGLLSLRADWSGFVFPRREHFVLARVGLWHVKDRVCSRRCERVCRSSKSSTERRGVD